MISVSVNFDPLFHWLDKAEAAFTQNPAAWRAMAIPYYQFTSKNFNRQGHPEKWPDLAESTKRSRRSGKNKSKRGTLQIGVDTGVMRASLTGPAAAASVMTVSNDSLSIGSTLKRAKWFHGGTINAHGRPQQPPRPVLVSPDAQTAADMLRAFRHVALKSIK